jgi:hypothetical protein
MENWVGTGMIYEMLLTPYVRGYRLGPGWLFVFFISFSYLDGLLAVGSKMYNGLSVDFSSFLTTCFSITCLEGDYLSTRCS